jgi:hypothetical protein
MDPDKWPVDEKPIAITRSVVEGHEHEYQVFAYGEPVVRGSDGRLDVSRVRGKRKELYRAEGEPAFFTYEQAETVAHKFGNYIFFLGNFVDTYVSGLREEE